MGPVSVSAGESPESQADRIPGQPFYQLNPALLVMPQRIGGERVFAAETNSAAAPLILRSGSILKCLLSMPTRFTFESLVAELRARDIEASLAEAVATMLVDEGLVLDAETASEADTWRRYGWDEAYAYHASTMDYPFVRMDRKDAFDIDESRMKTYLGAAPPPDIYQHLPCEASIQLTKIGDDDNADRLLARLTADERRALPGLSFFFDLCFGEREKCRFNVQGEFLLKAVPSGGSRHPTEAFLISFDDAWLPCGVYHYNVARHALDRIRSGRFDRRCSDATFDLFKKYDAPPRGLLVFTSLFERAMWRYRDARSWRAVLVDMGHTLMLYRLASRALGYRHYTYQKFDDAALCEIVGLDPLKQAPLFVGTLV